MKDINETNFEHLASSSEELAREMVYTQYIQICIALHQFKTRFKSCETLFEEHQVFLIEALCDKVRKDIYDLIGQDVGYMEDWLDNDPWD